MSAGLLSPCIRVRGVSIVFAGLAVSLLAGCATTGGGSPSPKPEREALPLLPDPGPASDRPATGLESILKANANAQGWTRALVELRRQVDLDEVMRRQRDAGLARIECRDMTRRILTEVAQRSQKPLLARLDEMLIEGELDYYDPLRFRNRIYVSATPAAILELREHPRVARILPEKDSVRDARREAGAQTIQEAPPIPPGDSWAVEALELDRVWDRGIDGSGVTVAVLDSGVMGDHAAFAGNGAEPFWYDPARGEPQPYDTVPHGSQVLSCAVGRTVEGRRLGAAPGASWVAALSNFHNSYNNVYMSLAADWILFETEADVVLGAWGHGAASCHAGDRAMIEAFRAAGMVPVFAAGNDGPEPGTAQTPAALSGFFPDGRGPLAVGAVGRSLEVLDASSRGPVRCEEPRGRFPDVVAPGRDLPVPTAPHAASLTLASGTSFAVGWVGGTVALMLQVAPDMPVERVEELIRSTADDLPPEGVDSASGHGLVNPAAAVEAALTWAREHSRSSQE